MAKNIVDEEEEKARLGRKTLQIPAQEDTLASILEQLNVALSTRASQTTLANILGQLDVALSTRATEATLAGVRTEVERSDTRNYGTVTVQSVSATQILAANSTRKSYLIYNNGNVNVYLGSDNSVTSANGMPLVPGALAYEVCDKGIIYGRAASATCDIRYFEVG